MSVTPSLGIIRLCRSWRSQQAVHLSGGRAVEGWGARTSPSLDSDHAPAGLGCLWGIAPR